MIIQTFTYARNYENGFYLYQIEYINCVEVARQKLFIESNDKMQMDIWNIGLAMKHIIDNDKRFGGVKKHEYFQRVYDQNIKKGFYDADFLSYPNGVKRYAQVFSDNYDAANECLARMMPEYSRETVRIFQMREEFGIKICAGTEKEILTDENIASLRKQYD